VILPIRPARWRGSKREEATLRSSTLPSIPAKVATAARAASDKLARDILLLEVGQVMALTDWFVIATGNNSRQVRTVADEVTGALKAAGAGAPRIEGLNEANWVLLDFGDVVVHVFQPETREFYGLERLWADVPAVEWSDELDRVAAGA
jgi:ribosome-associated protein